MSSNKFSFIRTVKFQIASGYAILFLVSFLLIFVIVFLHLSSAGRNAVDTRLNALFNEVEYEYLTGTELRPGQTPIRRLDKVPAEIYQKIAKSLIGFTPLIVFRNMENKTQYTLFGKCGQKLYRVEGESGSAPLSIQTIDSVDRHKNIVADLAGETFGESGEPEYRLLLNEQGKILAQSPFSQKELPLLLSHPYKNNSTRIQYETINGTRHRIRLAYCKLFNGEFLILGIDMHGADEALERVVNTFLWVGATVFLLSILTGWCLARRMFVGVDRVGRMAREIAAGDYSLRVASGKEGLEIENLVANFNFMVENTEKLMLELRTISDNIAHDLRTPLTRMLVCAEVTFSGEQLLSTYRDALADNAEECRRMLTLINTMLEISRTESGTDLLKSENFDAVELLRHSIELFQMAAEQKKMTISAELPLGPVTFYGDRMKIQQMFGNLIDNAVKFTPTGGKIDLVLAESNGRLVFSVSDTGPGIAETDLENVFKRFYRTDSSRNQPGNGLGLSLVQAIVHAHDGNIELKSTLEKGSCFTVFLPQKQRI